MICRLRTPALDHSVRASLWFCGLCIFWTGRPLCWFLSPCLRGCWSQVAFARTTRHLQDWNLPSDTEKKHCNSSWSFQVRTSEPCNHRFGLPFPPGVDSCFFLVTGFFIDTTSMVFWSFITGHGCKLSPGCINSEVEAFSGPSFVLHGLFGKRKEQYETTHFSTARVGKKAKKNITGFELLEMLFFNCRFVGYVFLATSF